MNSIFTIPLNGKTVDLSAIVAVSAIEEDYKYVDPFLFTVTFATATGGASTLVGSDTYTDARDDHASLLQAWEAYKENVALLTLTSPAVSRGGFSAG